jgi:flagellar biogenesis protein FliO
MTSHCILCLAFSVASSTAAKTSQDLPAKAPELEPTRPAESIERRLDTEAIEEPPPSAWDRRQEGDGGQEPSERQEGISWGEQLLKTVVALLIVVGLIYLLFRVGLTRFVGVAALKSGKTMKVMERIQLDARHALLIVELDGARRYLLGTGERGIQLLARLDEGAGGDGAPPIPRASFQDAMVQAARDDSDSEDSNA